MSIVVICVLQRSTRRLNIFPQCSYPPDACQDSQRIVLELHSKQSRSSRSALPSWAMATWIKYRRKSRLQPVDATLRYNISNPDAHAQGRICPCYLNASDFAEFQGGIERHKSGSTLHRGASLALRYFKQYRDCRSPLPPHVKQTFSGVRATTGQHSWMLWTVLILVTACSDCSYILRDKDRGLLVDKGPAYVSCFYCILRMPNLPLIRDP